MSPETRLLVVGELNPDAIVAGPALEPEFGQAERLADSGLLTVGSSGAILACGAARLGLHTSYLGVAGADAAGRFLLAEMADRGVDVSRCELLEGERTGLSVIITRGDDRAILTATGAMSRLVAADVDEDALAGTGHLHVSSPHLQPRLREGLAGLFERARAAGATTSLDPNWDPSGSWDGLDDVLEQTDVFLLNEEEARRSTGDADPEAALAQLAQRIGTVVIKRGATGAIARRGSESAAVAAPRLEAVDATGAGDNLTAGLLFGLAHGESLEGALRLGVACGSLSTRALGGVEAQAEAGEARELAARLAIPESVRSSG